MVVRVEKEGFKVETFDRISYQLIVMKGAFVVKHLLEVRKIITEFVQSGVNNIIFDMDKVDRIDSSSLGLLVNLYKQLSKKSGLLGVLNPSVVVAHLLETTMGETIKVFSSIESIDEHFEL